MPETPEEDLSYLNNVGNEPEPEDEPVEEPAEPEEEPAEPAEDPAEEPDPEEEPEEEPALGKSEVTVEQPRKRAETRIQKLANERAQEREARIRAEAKLEALQQIRQTAPAADNTEAMRLRKEKLDLMEPLERAVFLQNEKIEQMNHQMLITQLQSQDSADKAAFEAKATVDPRYARNKDEVEKELREMRSKGINATREQALALVLGRKLLGEKPRKAERAAAKRRVDAVTGKPTNARSTPVATAGKGDSLSDLESRLRGKSFNAMFNN